MYGPAQKAIEAALNGNWESAEKINKQILKVSPRDEECLNRLARVYLELGKTDKAIINYKKVVRFNRYNTIAQKALLRLTQLQKKAKPNVKALTVITTKPLYQSATVFIEEPGKTKTVILIHLGDKSVINNLVCGEEVLLFPHAHRVSVQTQEGYYLGRLPDDLSQRLIKLIRTGNIYQAFIKSVFPGDVRVFIREAKRSPALSDVSSFPLSDKHPNSLINGNRPNKE